MSHLTPEQLSAHLDGVGTAAERADAERHLGACAECRDALAALAALDASLGRALAHDPGDAYFERFADRVEQRLRAEGLHGAQQRGRDPRERWWVDWLRSPRRLAWLGAMAAVIGGAAIVLVTSREDRMSALDAGRVARESRVDGSAPAPEAGDRQRVAGADERAAQPGGATGSSEAGGGSPAASGAVPMTQATGNDAAMRPSDTAPTPGPREKAEAASPAAPSAAPLAANAPGAEPKGATGAPPARLMEVRKDASGDYVPVNPPAGTARLAPPPAAAPEPKPGEPMRVRKQNFAQPLGSGAAVSPPTEAGADAGAPSAMSAESGTAAAGESELCGSVADVSHRPLSGASITLVGLGRVTFSGPDGRFCMSAPEGDHELLVSAVGFGDRRVQVRVAGERAEVQVALDAVSVLGDRAKIASGARVPGIASGLVAPPRAGALALEGATADPFAALPDSVRLAARDAQRLTVAATTQNTASAYELAAGRWEAVLASVPPTGPAAVSARYHIAEARYGAWRATPTTARATGAARALDAYLASAPSGAQRDLAMRWRAALPH